jgi:protein ImuB
LRIEQQPPVAIAGWAGPWPLDVRWWDRLTARRRARFQIATVDGAGLLMVCENGRWFVEALYD